MKIYNKAKNKNNKKLKEGNQKLRILEWSNEIKLSNGYIIEKENKSTFTKRINGKSIKFIDLLYSIDRNERKSGKKLLKHIWNKGLTKETDTRLKKLSEDNKGKKLSKETRKKISEKNKGRKPWCNGLTKETDTRLKKLSEDRKGNGNPCYGKYWTEEQKKIKSDLMKEKIKNGTFTPNIHNSYTHWQAIYNGKKYRSSWEAVFHHLNPEYLYEKLRIPYKLNNETKIYIVDFINENKKIVVEIKPLSKSLDEKTKTKEKALIKWCEENNYQFKMLNENYFHDNFKKMKFKNFKDNDKIYNIMEKLYNEIEKKNKNKKTK